MKTPRTLAVGMLMMAFFGHELEGQELSRYRGFEMGSSLAAVLTLTGEAASAVRTIHARPAVLKDLEWRPSRWLPGAQEASTDPVEQMFFSFYNDQLFRIVVVYGSQRTEGMTSADMVEAISGMYGTPAKRAPGAVRPLSRVESDAGSLVAEWRDAAHVAVLYRIASYRQEFRLIVTDPALDVLALKSAVQAVRLDEQEAPIREAARRKKELDDARVAAAKARAANKDVFEP